MGKVVVFVNQKGGVGKTTSAISIGAFMALAGRRVLLIDFDPQANCSSGLGVGTGSRGIYEVLSGRARIKDIIKSTPVQGLSIVPSSIDLSGATVELVNEEDQNGFLKRHLAEIRNEYDFVFIDCPPSLGVLTLNGLAAADEVFIPLQCEYFALEGLSLILQTISKVQRGLNPSLAVGGIFFTMYDSRTKLSQDVVQQVTGYFKNRVFRTIIPRNVRLSEAPSHGLPISSYDPDCAGARSYRLLAEEVMSRG
jgi:chromosome partitioning protein